MQNVQNIIIIVTFIILIQDAIGPSTVNFS